VAEVAESTVTLLTVAASPGARLIRPLMAPENALPFCSRVTLSELGVLELKNFSQFAVICAAAAELPEEGADDAGADDAGALVAPVDEELEGELEVLQAATAAASVRASAGARMIRRATSWDRMTRS
jgi:hypothetical protein